MENALNAYTGWLILGAVLMILEIVVPGVFLLWIGLAGILTGVLVFFFPALPFTATGTVFAVCSVVFACVGRKLIAPAQAASDASSLNNRLESYVGQIFQAQENFADGRGKIKVGDTVWVALCDAEIKAGQAVKAVGVQGTFLKIEPANEQQSKQQPDATDSADA